MFPSLPVKQHLKCKLFSLSPAVCHNVLIRIVKYKEEFCLSFLKRRRALLGNQFRRNQPVGQLTVLPCQILFWCHLKPFHCSSHCFHFGKCSLVLYCCLLLVALLWPFWHFLFHRVVARILFLCKIWGKSGRLILEGAGGAQVIYHSQPQLFFTLFRQTQATVK